MVGTMRGRPIKWRAMYIQRPTAIAVSEKQASPITTSAITIVVVTPDCWFVWRRMHHISEFNLFYYKYILNRKWNSHSCQCRWRSLSTRPQPSHFSQCTSRLTCQNCFSSTRSHTRELLYYSANVWILTELSSWKCFHSALRCRSLQLLQNIDHIPYVQYSALYNTCISAKHFILKIRRHTYLFQAF